MSDVPAVPDPKQMRVSHADRERVSKVLHDAMAEGRLSVDELEERLDTLYAAKTFGELEPITIDLPAHQPITPQLAPQRALAAPVNRVGGQPTSSTAIAVMAGAVRKGQWTVPARFHAVAVMGGVEIDLTQATFEQSEVTINVFALMGGVEITVPPDVTVRCNGFGLMGAFDDRTRTGDQPGVVVHVTGFALMGGVDIRNPKVKRKQISE